MASFVSTICLMDSNKMEIGDYQFTFEVMHLADQIQNSFWCIQGIDFINLNDISISNVILRARSTP